MKVNSNWSVLLFMLGMPNINNAQTKDYNDFVIIVTSYNNAKYYQKNLASILNQKYPVSHFRIIYTDDCSTDGTASLVKEYISNCGGGVRFDLFTNEYRKCCLENHYNMLELCQSNEVAILVDGDDFLVGEDVLDTVNDVYQRPEIVLTYGQYKAYTANNRTYAGICKRIPDNVVNNKAYRQYFKDNMFCASHLKTFKVGLFNKICISNLQRNGKFFPLAGDVALMCSLLEKSEGKFIFIDKVLYGYNTYNPLNTFKIYNKSTILNSIYNIKENLI